MCNYATINLVNELARLPGVGNVTVMGAGEYSMRIWMDPQKLYSFGLVPKDVIEAVRAAEPGGRGRAGRHAAGAEGPAIPIHRRHPVAAERSRPVRRHRRQGPDRPRRPPDPCKDVGRIELGSQTYSQDFKLDGKPAAGIAIYQTPDANSLKVGKEVAAKMAELSRRFPQGLHYGIPYDTTIFIKNSINEVYKTLWQAGLLVLIVILVFLQNFRATLVPATTVPVTIIGAFAGMAALGYTVNLSTLFGIVLAIGIVVDDAIVIVEGVSKYIEQGMSGHDAAIKAMDELFGPIIGITLVLMAVFLPSAFVPGLTGKMFAQFALVIAATALISAVNAATLKPTQCALWLRTPVPPEQRNFFYRGFNRVYEPDGERLHGFIGRMVRRSGMMVVIGLVLAGRGHLGYCPAADRLHSERRPGLPDAGRVQLPDGAALGRTTAALEAGDQDRARDTPGVTGVIAISGMSVLDNFADLANAGTCFVMLKPWE